MDGSARIEYRKLTSTRAASGRCSAKWLTMLMSGLTPTPPATKTRRRSAKAGTPGGGYTKLPPVRRSSAAPAICACGRQSHCAGAPSGDVCTASST